MRVQTCSLIALLALSQLPQPAFRAKTELVALNVTVTDDKGTVVRGLARDAFTVTEDGKPTPIVQFASDPLPLSLVIALDASGSMAGRRFEFASEAVTSLLDRRGPDDEVVVYGFNDRPFVLKHWSDSRTAHEMPLNCVAPSGETALYDMVVTGLDQLRLSTHRRQALVVISDGNDERVTDRQQVSTGSDANRQGVLPPGDFSPAQRRSIPALNAVRRAEALAYAIGVDAPTAFRDARIDAAALRKLTDPTGGSTVIVRSDEAVVGAAERIGDELRQQYVLGFAPAHPGDGKFHSVKVTVTGCGKCRARARAGFIADSPPNP